MNQLYTEIINSIPKDLKYRPIESINEIYSHTLNELKAIAEKSLITATTKNAKTTAERIANYIDFTLAKTTPTDRAELLNHFFNTILAIERNDTLIGYGYHKYEKTEESHIRIISRNLLNPEKDSIYQHHRDLEIANENYRQELKDRDEEIDIILAKQEAKIMNRHNLEIAF